MPTFTYKAKISPQELITGRIQADDRSQAVNSLTSRGYFPVSVSQETDPGSGGFVLFNKISGREGYLFSHQLAVLLNSGSDMPASLKTIADQARNKRLKNVVAEVAAGIKDGHSLSQALSAYPEIFNNFYLAMIRCAESGGNLEQTLEQLAEYAAKEEELKSVVSQAFIYPAFVAGVGMLTIGALVGFVVPQLSSMFSDFDRALPLPTRILLNIAGFLQAWWPAVIIGGVLAGFILSGLRKNTVVRKKIGRLVLGLPAIGDIIVKINLRYFCRSLSALLSAGVPIVPALKTAQDTVSNGLIKDEVGKIADRVDQGQSFHASLAKLPYFPPLAANVISVGEASGDLEKSLMRVSSEYESDVDRQIRVFTKLLEPMLILIMGLIVGFIVIAMLLPMFQMDLMVK